MDEPRPWMHKVFSKAELNELLRASERIMRDDDEGIIMNLTLTNNQCMDFVHHWTITRDDVETLDMFESVAFIEDFLWHMVNFLEAHLNSEVPNWREYYYGVDPED